MKKLITIAITLLFLSSVGYSQGIMLGYCTIFGHSEFYVNNSPTGTCGNRKAMGILKDSTYFRLMWPKISFKYHDSNRNDGTPSSVLWTGDTGTIYRSPITELRLPYSSISDWVTDTIQAVGNELWYDKTNPLSFISGISGSDVTTALGYTPVNPSSLGTVAFDNDYNSLDNLPTIPAAQVNSDWNASSGPAQILNKPTIPTNNNQLTNGAAYITDADIKVRSVNGDTGDVILTTTEIAEGDKLYFNTTRARAAFSSGTGISLVNGVISNTAPDQTVSISSGTGISVTGTYPNFTVASTATIPTINSNVSRPINNTTFTISSTKQASVVYTITISCTSTLLNGASGKVVLQYSTDGGSTWVTVDEISNVVSGVVSTNVQTGSLNGSIPANASVRMVTTSSNSTVTYVRGQEVY